MSGEERSVGDLAESILRRHQVVGGVDVAAGSCRVRVETNSGELIEGLESYFRPFLAPPGRPDVVVTAFESDAPTLDLRFADWERDAGKTGRKDAFADLRDGRAVLKVKTGMQYLLGAEHRLVFGRVVRNANQVVNFVCAQVINWLMHRDRVLCHAAGVVANGRGLAVAGVSGAGKSTLSLRLVASGLKFTSNDRLLVGENGAGPVMSGVPKQPRVNPGTLLSIPEFTRVLPEDRRRAALALSEDELFALEEKYDVDVAALFGDDRWALEAPLDLFLVLRWSRKTAEPTRFTRVSVAERPDVLAAIMKPPGPFFEQPGGAPRGVHRQAPADYAMKLSHVPVYEATGRLDFDAAVAFARETLGADR